MKRLTIKRINAELDKHIPGLRLFRDGFAGCHFFHGAGAENWPEATVCVPRTNDLTLAQWVDEALHLSRQAR